MNLHILYHANYCDGFCAAWVLSQIAPNDTKYHPMNYGDPLPEFAEDDFVIMVDCSRKRDEILALKERVRDLNVLDHHKTAEKELEGIEGCHFDMETSGAMLALLYAEATLGQSAPAHVRTLVAYVEDRDLWRFKLPYSKSINAVVQNTPKEFGSYSKLARLLHEAPEEAIKLGAMLIIAEKNYISTREAALANLLGIERYTVPVLNLTHLVSETLHSFVKGYPFAMSWWQRADGKFIYSLRSDDGGVDVSEIARTFGGGGHKHAAGFETDALVHVIVGPCPTSE